MAYSRLLLAIWASGGWNPETFDQLLYGGVPPALVETIRPTAAVYAQHCTASGVQRSDIAAAASLAMTNSSTNGLKVLDQISLYSSLAALFGAIGFTRREAYSIRRLQVLVVSLIASGIALQKTEPSISSQIIKEIDVNHNEHVPGTMVSTVSSTGNSSDSDSILILALQICQSYGVKIERLPLTNLNKDHILSRAAVTVKSGNDLNTPQLNRRQVEWSQTDDSTEDHTDAETARQEEQRDLASMGECPHFGWVSLQISIFQEAIAICELMQDEAAMLFFATIFLRDLWSYLTPEEQLRLKDGIAITQRSLLAKGQKISMEYWGPSSLMDDMQLISPADNIILKDIQSIDSETHLPNLAMNKRGDIKRVSGSQSAQLFDSDLVSFNVTLSNPFSVPLEIESIQLEASKAGSVGPSFKAIEAMSVIIPPMSHHTIPLSGTPHGEGKLLLKGIIVKMPFCVPKSFSFERTDGRNKEQLARFQSDCDDACTRIKVVGLEARNEWEQAGIQRVHLGPEDRFHVLQVVPQVPRLVVQGSSAIRNGSLVLYDGEERRIQMSVRNRSNVDIDYIRFHLEDDLQSEMLDILAEGRLDPVHVYELEIDLLHRPFIISDPENSQGSIKAGESKTLDFVIKGKLDVRRACIKMEYGNVRGAKELGREHFWTRISRMEFDVRVLPVFSVEGLEVTEGAEQGKEDQIMLGMLVHNLHTLAIDLDWHIADTIIHRHLAPNTTSHIYFSIPRIPLTNKEMEKAIPTLMERQFMFTSRDEKSTEIRRLKLQFWIRKAILELIKKHRWIDRKTNREGDINLSGLILPSDERLLSLCRQCPLRLHVNFEDPVEKFNFINLVARIENTSDDFINAQYRLIPNVSDRLSNHIQCTSGHLYGNVHPLKSLPPGESSEIRIGLCFLSSGVFHLLFRIVQNDMIIVDRRIEVIVP